MLLATLLFFSGCTARNEPITEKIVAAPKGVSRLKIAVFPVVNLSGTPAPLDMLNHLLINSLNQKALNLLAPDLIESVFAEHRIRYLGGLNPRTAQVLRQEAGAEAVLITSLELYSEYAPPKIALTSRLVSAANTMPILWMHGAGLAGDDSPGLLDFGLIEDPQTLMYLAVHHLSSSLARYLSGRVDANASRRVPLKFRPRSAFRAPILDPELKYRVAVLPFFNVSERKHAGEMMAMQFVRALSQHDNFFVIEPGVIRDTLLDMRIIMGDGLSLADADLIFSRLKADLVLSGNVIDYQDYKGFEGTPRVDFSAQIIEKKSREIAWAVQSHNQGDDRVFFFDWGRVNTAYAMTSQMVQLAVENLVQ